MIDDNLAVGEVHLLVRRNHMGSFGMKDMDKDLAFVPLNIFLDIWIFLLT